MLLVSFYRCLRRWGRCQQNRTFMLKLQSIVSCICFYQHHHHPLSRGLLSNPNLSSLSILLPVWLPPSDAWKQAAHAEGLLLAQLLQGSLQVLHQPPGGDPALPTEPRRVCHRAFHVRASSGRRVHPESLLWKEEHLRVSGCGGVGCCHVGQQGAKKGVRYFYFRDSQI